MSVDEELLEIDILEQGFNINTLWVFKENIIECKLRVEKLATMGKELGKMKESAKCVVQLYYLTKNIELVETVMGLKEIDLFYMPQFKNIEIDAYVCWN
jgi:hypothetical protein